MHDYETWGSLPFPELVLRDPEQRYRFFDTLKMPWLLTIGMTDKAGKRLFTPHHPAFRYVTLHELAHVKWSPDAFPELDFDPRVYQAVEDARINLGLAALGHALDIDADGRATVRRLVEDDLERGDVGAVVLRAVAGLGIAGDDDIEGWLAERGDACLPLVREVLGVVRKSLRKGALRRGSPVASPKRAIRLARELARELARRNALPQGDPRTMGIGCVFGGCVHADEEEALAVDALLDGDLDADPTLVPSGALTVTEAPLPLRARNPKSSDGRRWQRATEGSVLRYPHRLAMDQAVFRRPVRRHGGTVLIDASGSMRFRTGDLARLVDRAPGATLVAVYAGDGAAGELRVVARGGRRAADEDLRLGLGGNVVDVPSLEWLAKQPGPRIHVSDGRATGQHDRGTAGLRRHCDAIRRRAQIRRVTNLDQAGHWLAAR
ncbi:MAG: hypothetical protein AAF430_07985 [Myxococcota bacterium]